ncbi:Hsp70 family protein [Lyngbya sp. CCY1209]|uniref:Hsp70 family protein n=1 Tax=Lyngbya sp. CCY1209 TaxID=2886103 RepID=UPI002D2052DF|nr:Hsp70 family protein [Lyngbya sp. CCY1209]MEB3883896.1 Hsp70 family protein [Lyngbya sp. CCY1209]
MAQYKIGLDFGTTNSIISHIEDGKPVAFQYGGEQGYKYIPSFIAYEDDFIEIGQAARTTAANHPESKSYGNFKMDLPLTENFANTYPLPHTPTSVTADYLRELLLSPENEYSFTRQQGEIAGLVVSVPEIWQRDICNTGRENLQTLIAENLGLEKQLIQLVSEPVAAAAYYAWETQRRHREENREPFNGNLLVCDMGGGTFDVSLCRIYGENKVEVLYFDGQGDRGLESAGVAFDRSCVIQAYTQKNGLPPDADSTEFMNLLREFESVKIAGHNKYTKKLKNYLNSPSELADQTLYSFSNGYTLTSGEVARAFAPIAAGITRVLERVTTWMDANGQKCDRLFLVGGFCQFHLVQKTILDALNLGENDPTLESQFNLINSAFAISYGACLIANGLVQPSEIYIHTIGLVVHTINASTKLEEIFIPIIKGGTNLDDLASLRFADIPPLEAFHDTPTVTLGVDPQSRGKLFKQVLPDIVKLPKTATSEKWRVGMRVNRSQVAYLAIASEEGNKAIEYELGNIIAKMFPGFVMIEEDLYQTNDNQK